MYNGSVTINENANVAVGAYRLGDRTTFLIYDIQISNGIITYNLSTGNAQAEPVIADNVVAGVYWRLYMDNGILNIESAAVPVDDASLVTLIDTSSGSSFLVVVSDGNLGIALDVQSSEILHFTDNGLKIGTVIFGNIGLITVAGISDGTISIRGLNDMGQTVLQIRSINDNLPVRFYSQAGRIKMQKPGQIEVAQWKIIAEPDANIVENDVLEVISGAVGFTQSTVIWKELIYDFAGVTHHMECFINCIN